MKSTPVWILRRKEEVSSSKEPIPDYTIGIYLSRDDAHDNMIGEARRWDRPNWNRYVEDDSIEFIWIHDRVIYKTKYCIIEALLIEQKGEES